VEAYTAEYYEYIRQSARSSARVVAPLVFDLVRPRSVIDVGCGTGKWLSVFAAIGAEQILGLEQPGFNRSLLSVPPEVVVEHDLSHPYRPVRRFDLAVSLEVAEHLPPERAETFVEDLTILAPVVLFSAAVPGQADPKTHGHLNERWQSFWAELFAERDYHVVDCIRPATWEDGRVDFWYAQNTILYVASERIATDKHLERTKESQVFPLSVVNPRMEPISVGAMWHRCERWKNQRKKLKRRVVRLEQQLEAEHSKGLLQRVFKR
jgi:SAM-dependent methyltransferase